MRCKVVAESPTFFINTNGNRITKIFDIINRELKKRKINTPDGKPLSVSGSLIRKMVETAGREHGPEVTSDVAAHLQHSEATAKGHYQVDSARAAIQQHASLVTVEKSLEMESGVLDK